MAVRVALYLEKYIARRLISLSLSPSLSFVRVRLLSNSHRMTRVQHQAHRLRLRDTQKLSGCRGFLYALLAGYFARRCYLVNRQAKPSWGVFLSIHCRGQLIE